MDDGAIDVDFRDFAAAEVEAGSSYCCFFHSELGENEKVYIEMPLGFRKQGNILKLKTTLFGLCQSSRTFWKYLTKAREAIGMRVSILKTCLFVGDCVMAVAFVDDILF